MVFDIRKAFKARNSLIPETLSGSSLAYLGDGRPWSPNQGEIRAMRALQLVTIAALSIAVPITAEALARDTTTSSSPPSGLSEAVLSGLHFWRADISVALRW